MPTPKTDDDEAHLVSFTLVSYFENIELTDDENVAAALCPTYNLIQNDNENDDDVDSDVLVEPLPSEAAAYADPSVYATPEQGTSEKDTTIVDSSDDEMAFDYNDGSDESFYSVDANSEDESTDDDMICIRCELDRLSPAFQVGEGTEEKPIDLSSSTDVVTPMAPL